MIGDGAPGSSTHRYVAVAGDLANVDNISAADRVFVSANGQRSGRVPVVGEDGEVIGEYCRLRRARNAGATIVADTLAYREDKYNVGEKELAGWLQRNGYGETIPGSGVWTRGPTAPTMEDA